MIQVRERHLDDRALIRFVKQLLEVCGATACKVVVNERTDIAIAAGAHGVHLKSDSVPVTDARRLLSTEAVVGRSVHSATEAAAVAAALAQFLADHRYSNPSEYTEKSGRSGRV